MERTPEPTYVMTDVEQCKQYDLYTSSSSMMKDYVVEYMQMVDVRGGTIIDLGSGTCSYVIALCKQFPNLKFVCYELSDPMLAIARQKIAEAGFADRITLVQDDCFNATGTYDAVLANRLLHHIDDTDLFWKTITRLSEKVMVVDIDRPGQVVIDRVSNDDLNPVYREDLVNSMKAAYSLDEVKQQIKDYNLGAYADSRYRLYVYHKR